MLELLKKEEFYAVYDIMTDSFPKDEIRSFEQQQKLMQKSNYRIYVLKGEKHKEIKAFAAIYEYSDFVFLEHFAVNKKYRSCGVGSEFLKELTAFYKKPICLEVEEGNTDIALRRIAFYERNGFVLNNYPYIMPALSEDKIPVPLKIMYYNRTISQSEFTQIKNILYEDVYGVIKQL